MPTLLLPPPDNKVSPRGESGGDPSLFGSQRNDLLATGILSSIAGYVDAAGFLGLFGLFTAHITGDLVAAGTAFAGGGTSGMGLRLAPIAIFMFSVAATALVARATRRRGHRPLPAMLGLMTLALTVFCATGVALRSRFDGPDHWAVLVTGGVGVFAMGVQNTLMRGMLSALGPTTIMTGNLTRLTMDLVEAALPEDDGCTDGEAAQRRMEASQRLSKSVTPILAFLLGTALGGAATAKFGFWSISLPSATAAVLTLAIWLTSRAGAVRRRRTFELGLDHESVMLGDAVR